MGFAMFIQSLSTERHCRREGKSPNWRKRIPARWLLMVVAPLRFEMHREYEMAASRLHGYDEDDSACYYCHSYHLSAQRTDDDEEFYSTLVYGEEVEAWRLNDGRWLVWQVIAREEDEGVSRGFFSFSEGKPK